VALGLEAVDQCQAGGGGGVGVLGSSAAQAAQLGGVPLLQAPGTVPFVFATEFFVRG
jgi:hypothetical protein